MRTLTAATALSLALLLFLGRSGGSEGVEAGTAIRLDVSGLVAHADLVVEGRVLSAHALRTEDGRIETEYLLEVDRTFEGEDHSYRAIRLPGGVLEAGSGMILAGMPQIRAGENLLLFLTEEASSGVRMPVGLAQGKFSVVTDSTGHKSLVTNDAGVGLLNPTSGEIAHGRGLTILDYASVAAEIEAALAEERSR